MDAGYFGVGQRALEVRVDRGGVRFAIAAKEDLDFTYLGVGSDWLGKPQSLFRVTSRDSSNRDFCWWFKGGNAYYMSASPYVEIPIWLIGGIPVAIFYILKSFHRPSGPKKLTDETGTGPVSSADREELNGGEFELLSNVVF